jgi:hypothetical protein
MLHAFSRFRCAKNVMTTTLLAATFAASAQPVPPPPAAAAAHRDAAVQYWQAFAAMPAMDKPQQDLAAGWDTVPLDATAVKLIDASANALKQLRRGAACDHCDWGLNKEDSFGLLLPHLAKSRDLARLACLRARYRISKGQHAQAVDDVVDALVLARRVGADDVLIGILVQDAMQSIAVQALAPHLTEFGKGDLAALAARLATLPKGGTFEGFVVWEREAGLMALIAGLKDAQRDARPWDQYLSDNLGLPVETIRAAGGSPEAVTKHLEALRPLYDEFAAALKLPQAQAKLKFAELSKRTESNPMKSVMFNYSRVYDRHATAETRLTLLRAAVAIRLNGPDQLKQFTDPFTGEPFEHKPTSTGFELLSKVKDEHDKLVTLTIGPAAK